jgi:hypothetical protein
MLKNKYILLGAFLLLGLSSCGIFHKGCGCPTFGYLNASPKSSPKERTLSNNLLKQHSEPSPKERAG